MNTRSNVRQTGLVTVEFALIGGVFFLVLFGIIEMGRFLFTWNVLDEVTRRAARLAAVCPLNQTEQVKQSAVFNSSILTSLTTENIDIQYLKVNFGAFDSDDDSVSDIRYVQSSIMNYSYQMLIPGLPIDPFNTSSFRTTLPSESLGITPDGSWDVLCTGA